MNPQPIEYNKLYKTRINGKDAGDFIYIGKKKTLNWSKTEEAPYFHFIAGRADRRIVSFAFSDEEYSIQDGVLILTKKRPYTLSEREEGELERKLSEIK